MHSDYQRIAEAIRYLNRNARGQPGLEAVARHLGLSPAHLQRLFRRWAGISPKRFLQYLNAQHAEALLRASVPVLDTAFATGLSGPGRLHDLLITVHAATPGEIRAGGRGLHIAWGLHPSPFGTAFLAATPHGLCALSFPEPAHPDTALAALRHRFPHAALTRNPRATRTFFARIFPRTTGGPRAITLWLQGSNFQLKVWEALLCIPPGTVTTYGRVAAAAGRPRAHRAVGTAVGANPAAYLIPCHRVIRQSGALGEYRWYPVRKQAMLAWESAHPVT
jgi:AraC family transcriptional regulator of adaptative response/methylated-DNA-[protein]-cysteine methyltransferase